METQTRSLTPRVFKGGPQWLAQASLCLAAVAAAGVLTIEARVGPLAPARERAAPMSAPALRPAIEAPALRSLEPAAAAARAAAERKLAAALAHSTVSGSAAPAGSRPSPLRPSRTISEAELKRLADKAAQALKSGDIGGARMVLERAASAGDPSALFALGETYDPSVLRAMRVRGLRGDVAKARALYREASARGVAQASQRLSALNAANPEAPPEAQ